MKPLEEFSLTQFSGELAKTRFPSPAGGSACAAVLAMAAGLWELCCGVSARKAPSSDVWEGRIKRARVLRESGLLLIQTDTDAYEEVILTAKTKDRYPRDWQLAVRQATATLASLGENALTLLQQMDAAADDTTPSVQGDLITSAHLALAVLESVCHSITVNSRMTGVEDWTEKMDELVRQLQSDGRRLAAAILPQPLP